MTFSDSTSDMKFSGYVSLKKRKEKKGYWGKRLMVLQLILFMGVPSEVLLTSATKGKRVTEGDYVMESPIFVRPKGKIVISETL